MKKNVSLYGGPLKAVFFDWAGTVIDYGSCAPAVAFIEVFRNNGVEVTMAEARESMGLAKRDHIATILQIPAVRNRGTIPHGALPSEEDVNHLYEQFLSAQLQCLRDYGELIPVAIETVPNADAGA